MSMFSSMDASASLKCIQCGADISRKAKFCEECGAPQAAPSASSPERAEEALPESTARAIEPQPLANLPSSSTTANQTSRSNEFGSVDELASTRKKLGIAAAVVVVAIALACIGAWYLRAHERQKARDNYNLGLAYENGQGVPQDEAQAISWYHKAADQGNADAQERLGDMYFYSLGGLAKDEAQAVSWYRKAAEQGNAEAQGQLGAAYGNGRGGLARDYAQAVSWYRKAAEQGNAYAQYNLGVMYLNGLGVPKDEAQAVFWNQKAVDQGLACAQYNLGVMYENGVGGLPQSDELAVSWYRKASDQGYAQAKDAPARLLARRQQEQRLRALNGEDIDFTALYVKGMTNSVIVGKRYRFRATIDIYGTNGTDVKLFATNDDSKGLSAVLDLDPDSPVSREKLLQGDSNQVHTMVGSCCAGSSFIVERIEY